MDEKTKGRKDKKGRLRSKWFRFSGEYQVKLHIFTLQEWKQHVKDFGKAGGDLWVALGEPP